MPSGRFVTAATRPRWAFALHFDEVVIVRIIDMDEGKNTAEVQIFTLTANRCFWPYMPQNVFYLSCSSLLCYLPRNHQPTCVPYVTHGRKHMERGHGFPVSLPLAAWHSFTDIRNAHHARLKDRSLAARKEERWEAREDSDDEMSCE